MELIKFIQIDSTGKIKEIHHKVNITKIEFKHFIDVDLKPCIYDTQSNDILFLTINYIKNKQIQKPINKKN